VAGAALALTACGGDDGPDGSASPDAGTGQGSGGSSGGADAGGDAGTGLGGEEDGSTGNEPTASFPSDSSAAGLLAFLETDAYKNAPWMAETAAPREQSSPYGHGDVIVYLNDVLVASQQAGNGELQGTAHDPGSMSVKEFYDEGGDKVGHAVMLKLEGAFSNWAYYCVGSSDRCRTNAGPFTEADPHYSTGTMGECGFCHGGMIFTDPNN
jgi:hypothetical protein